MEKGIKRRKLKRGTKFKYLSKKSMLLEDMSTMSNWIIITIGLLSFAIPKEVGKTRVRLKFGMPISL